MGVVFWKRSMITNPHVGAPPQMQVKFGDCPIKSYDTRILGVALSLLLSSSRVGVQYLSGSMGHRRISWKQKSTLPHNPGLFELEKDCILILCTLPPKQRWCQLMTSQSLEFRMTPIPLGVFVPPTHLIRWWFAGSPSFDRCQNARHCWDYDLWPEPLLPSI